MKENNMDYITREKYSNENKKIYSDHNSILINFDFETSTEEQRPKETITKKI